MRNQSQCDNSFTRRTSGRKRRQNIGFGEFTVYYRYLFFLTCMTPLLDYYMLEDRVIVLLLCFVFIFNTQGLTQRRSLVTLVLKRGLKPSTFTQVVNGSYELSFPIDLQSGTGRFSSLPPSFLLPLSSCPPFLPS